MEINFKTQKIKPLECPACQKTEVIFWREKNNFKLYKCKNCGLIFVFPQPAENETIYSEDYFCGKGKFGYADYDKDKEAMRPIFEKYLKLMEKYSPEKGNLLDVGAATGFFLKIAEMRNWKVYGVEISEYAAAEARKKGLNVFTGKLENAYFQKDSFDAVTFWDVFEHLPQPEQTLKIVFNLLKPKGLLAINLPDSGSLYAKITGKRWHAFVPPEHLFYFNKKNLESLLGRGGFEVLESKRIGKKFTLPYLIQILSSWLNCPYFLKLLPLIFKLRLDKWPIPINLMDNLFILARKKLT